MQCRFFFTFYGGGPPVCPSKTSLWVDMYESRPHVVYFNGSLPGHCLASVESGVPNDDGLIGRTDTAKATVVGGVGVCVFASVSVCARGCVHACVRDVIGIYDIYI